MSNKKLIKAKAPGHLGPFFPSQLTRIQEAYLAPEYAKKPIDQKFLEYFVEEMAMYFRKVKLNPDFETVDGTKWYAVRFEYITDTYYRLLFPKGMDEKLSDGTVSSQHVALLVYSDERPPEDEISQVAKTQLGLFEHDLSHFYPAVVS